MADDVQENLLAQLKVLHDDYAKRLPDKVSQIRSGLDTLRSGWGDALLRTLHRQVHSLTGSGAMFGYAVREAFSGLPSNVYSFSTPFVSSP